MAAKSRLVIDQHHLFAVRSQLHGCLQACRTASDNRYFHMPVTVFVFAGIRSPRWRLTQPGNLANEWLGGVPRAGVGHHLVIPPHRHQPIEPLRDGEPIMFERRIGILVPDSHSGAHGRHAGAHVGHAVHVHHAVGTFAGQAQQAPRPVVFETARKNALPRTIQGGSYGIAGARLDRLAAVIERERVGALVQAYLSGKNVSRTSLVTVFLTACIH